METIEAKEQEKLTAVTVLIASSRAIGSACHVQPNDDVSGAGNCLS